MGYLNSSTCGLCGEPIDKAVRVVDGVSYCRKCIKKGRCPICGGGSLVPRTLGSLPCRKCSIEGRVCARCGKPLPQADRLVGDKAYCYPCTRHLDEPQPCELCGEPSRYLAKDLKNGIAKKACPKCRRLAGSLIYCSRCGGTRPLGGLDAHGKKLCPKCYASYLAGAPAMKCSSCGSEATWFRRGKCLNCYTGAYVHKTISNHATTLSQEWVKGMANRFADNVCRKFAGSAPKRLKRYLDYFTVMDGAFKDSREITTESLASVFGGYWRRRNPLLCSQLISEGILPPYDGKDFEEAAHYHKQKKCLEAARGKWYHGLLVEFHEDMQQRVKVYRDRGWKGKHIKFSQRTVGQALAIVSHFLDSTEYAGVNQTTQLDSAMFSRYMLGKPGSKGALASFVRFLNERKKTFKRLRKIKRFKIELGKEIPLDKYHECLSEWTQPPPGKAGQAIAGLFATLYAQSAFRIVRMKLSDVEPNEDGGFNVRFAQPWLPMPNEVSRVIAQYLQEREAECRMRHLGNPYLFPGKDVVGSHLFPGTVSLWFKKYGVTGSELYRTALLKFFRNGTQTPKVAEVALGINAKTAAKYFNAVDVRLRNEIRGWDPRAK